MQPVAAMLVAGSNWDVEDHLMLVQCVRDSMSIQSLALVVDQLHSSALTLPLCEMIILLAV